MLTDRYLPHPVRIKSALSSAVATWLTGVMNYSIDFGINLIKESSAGSIDHEYLAQMDKAGKINIQSTDLSFLATCGMAGLFIIPDATHAGVELYFRKISNGGLPIAIATTTHLKALVSDGLMVPTKVSASHNQLAKLDLMLHAILGSVATYSQSTPVTLSSGTAIESGAGAMALAYTTGPVKYNSTLVQGISDENIDFGVQVNVESDSGEVYPTHVSIPFRAPNFTFTTKDQSVIASIGEGVSCSSGFGMYFRKVAPNGDRVAIATAEHIKISAAAGELVPGAASLTHKQMGVTPFTFTPTGAVTISAASAIPAS